MFQDRPNIMDDDIYAYLLVERKTGEILDLNNLAQEYYMDSGEMPNLEEIFSPTADEKSVCQIVAQLDENGSISLENLFSHKKSEETFPCHVEICSVNPEHLFFVISDNSNKSELDLNEFVERTGNPVLVLEQDENLTIYYQNDRCKQYTKLNSAVKDAESTSFLSLLPPEKRDNFHLILSQHIQDFGECDVDVELTFGREYFQLFHFNVTKSNFNKKLYGVLIAVKKQSDLLKLIEFEQQYLDVLQKFTKDLLFRIDIKKRTLVHRGDISNFNDLSNEVEQYPECMRSKSLVHPEDLEGYITFAYRLMSGVEATFEAKLQLKNGSYEKYRLQGSPLVDGDGNTIQVVGKCENIQKLVDIENKAHYDALTTTLNKQSFKELVEDSINRAVGSDKFALLFIDLDNFKGVNDTLGHTFGDFLLEAMGKRIKNCIRSKDRVGRVGGDEFVVFFQFAPNPESVQERAEAILHSLRRDFTYGEQHTKVKASIGIALYPDHGSDYQTIYDKADKALYKSKDLGKDVATIYDISLEK